MFAKTVRYINTLKTGFGLLSEALQTQVRDEWLGQHIPPKPKLIQLPINDICNADCVMCNIGKRKRDYEITPDELRKILKDPLFQDVQYVGISGGEPTLRSDLPEIGKVLAESLPKLTGMGIITNAVREKMVIDRVDALAKIAKEKGLFFSINISLDGIGEVHDKNRGVQGNFDSAVKVIRSLQQLGYSISIGCTLTPLNCYDADDVLSWCRENAATYEFRLAVDIKRVYNEGYAERFPLNPEQRFHLIMFFDKLSSLPEVDPEHQKFYKSLVAQLAYQLPRSAGCGWKTRGVTLDSRGNISYCSVESPILGSALHESASTIFKNNLSKRRYIVQQKCSSCQHDLLGAPTPPQLFRKGLSTMIDPWRNKFKNLSSKLDLGNNTSDIQVAKEQIRKAQEWRHVLITGWYGTETTGDKAILGELANFLRERSPKCTISLTTMDLKVTQQTLKEVPELSNTNLLSLKDGSGHSIIADVDAVIIGGGPLEEIPESEKILEMFVEANKQRKARILFGCGVGPLYTDNLKQIVRTICRLATGGFLRDEESNNFAKELSGISFPVACDPALAYFRRWYIQNKANDASTRSNEVITFLRANTNEYLHYLSSEDIDKLNDKRSRQFAEILDEIIQSTSSNLSLLSMHYIPVGGDDRIFNRTVVKNLKHSEHAKIEKAYFTLPQLMSRALGAKAAIVMRYHAHLLCIAFGIPILSLDYTGKTGKVDSLIRRIGIEEYSEDWSSFDKERFSMKAKKVFQNREMISTDLQKKTDQLLDELRETYRYSFDI